MTMPPATADLQSLCQIGQERLTATDYLGAERALADAERIAFAARDWDTLARLYMPLQEARRQRRQLCGEGTVVLDLLAESPVDRMDARHILGHYPCGQLMVAGWGTIQPAADVRRLQAEHGLYVETFLGAVYPVTGGARAVVIVPTEDVTLPPPDDRPLDLLLPLLPPHTIVLPPSDLPAGARQGSPATFAETMAIWERLHLPFLALADATTDPVLRIDAYRKTIRVDYACELAHQRLSDTAHELVRSRKARG